MKNKNNKIFECIFEIIHQAANPISIQEIFEECIKQGITYLQTISTDPKQCIHNKIDMLRRRKWVYKSVTIGRIAYYSLTPAGIEYISEHGYKLFSSVQNGDRKNAGYIEEIKNRLINSGLIQCREIKQGKYEVRDRIAASFANKEGILGKNLDRTALEGL